MTTATGHEGAASQHIIALRSTDRGKTWSKPVRLEPRGGPENSYAVLLKVPGGRVYCFYNHNTDNVREIKTENGGAVLQVRLYDRALPVSEMVGNARSAR